LYYVKFTLGLTGPFLPQLFHLSRNSANVPWIAIQETG